LEERSGAWAGCGRCGEDDARRYRGVYLVGLGPILLLLC
jgi:hypothetical protein